MFPRLNLATIVVSFFFIVVPLAKVWPQPNRPTSLVVYPLPDPTLGEANQKTTALLREKLVQHPFLHVVDPKNVEVVLKYYQNYRLGSDFPLAEQAKGYLAQAKGHYFQLAYAEAQAELNEVFQIFKTKPELIFIDGLLLLDSYLTLGLIHTAAKRPEEARAAFQQAYRIHPYYRVDAKAFSPSVRKRMQEAYEDLKRQVPYATLKVEGQPKVTEIYLNGIYQGVSPRTFASLPAGEYALTFKAQHYQPFQQHVVLQPNTPLTLKHKLFWQGSEAQSGRNRFVKNREEIAEGLRIAELLKVDKVLLVQVKDNLIQARLVDRQYRAAHKPIAIFISSDPQKFEADLDQFARLLYAQTQIDLLKNPQAHLDPEGVGDPILLSGRRHKISKGVLFGGLGVAGVGGILAAVLAGGGSSGPNTGSIALSFR